MLKIFCAARLVWTFLLRNIYYTFSCQKNPNGPFHLMFLKVGTSWSHSSSNCQVLGISVFWAPRSWTSCPGQAEQMARQWTQKLCHHGHHSHHTWSAWSCSVAFSWENEGKALPWMLTQSHMGLSGAGLHRRHILALLIKLPGRASWSKQHRPEGVPTE